MRIHFFITALILIVTPFAAYANEKATAQGQIEAARAAIEAFARKTDGNNAVAADLEAARAQLKKGEEALAGGSTMFGLGDVSQDTGQEVKINADMVDLYLVMGQSRLDALKTAEELEILKAQVNKMKAKVKIFDDRKAEMDRLRANQAKFEATLKELADAKAENGRLTEKAAKLEQERQALEGKVEQLKAELAKPAAPAAEAPAPPAMDGASPAPGKGAAAAEKPAPPEKPAH